MMAQDCGIRTEAAGVSSGCASAIGLYPACKNSSVEWLGAVPANWEVRRLKTLLDNIRDSGGPISSDGMRLSLENVESWTGRILPSTAESAFGGQGKRFRAGDVLFGKLRPYLAKVTRPVRDGVCVSEFLVLRPKSSAVVIPYMELVLRSKPVIEIVDSSTFGARMPRAEWGFIGGLPICLPPLAEQSAIVRFLDRADRRIRRYIRAKERLIELLEERKRALIHEAVTGRTDVSTGQPYPAYKDSGIEWLGKVPEHWDVRRLKHWLEINRQVLPEDTDPEYRFAYLDIRSVATGRLTENPKRLRFGDAPSRARRIVAPGDTIVSTVRTYLKAVWHAKSPGTRLIASTGFAVLTPGRNTVPEFVSYTCQSDAFTDRVTAESVGIAYPAISEARFGTFSVCAPPLCEQRAIARFLDHADRRIRCHISATKRQIALLKEYRTRLIADVVTGKLDVREATTALPVSVA